MKYKFLGKPDKRFPNLITGKIYDLEVFTESTGIFGWLVGNTRPVIIHPFHCPYRNWDTFYQNWQNL